jgi:hypothetical protein
MSYCTQVLWILAFILLYSEHIFFLAGFVPAKIPRLASEAGFGSDGGSIGFAGEHQSSFTC